MFGKELPLYDKKEKSGKVRSTTNINGRTFPHKDKSFVLLKFRMSGVLDKQSNFLKL